MPNLYGIANAPNLFVEAGLGSTLVPTVGVETIIIDSGPMIAPSNGWFYPVVWTLVYIQWGASLPVNPGINARIGAGADFDQFIFNGSTLVPSTLQWQFTPLVGPPSQTPWQGAGSHIYVTVLFPTNTATVSQYGTKAYIWLMRAPDQ